MLVDIDIFPVVTVLSRRLDNYQVDSPFHNFGWITWYTNIICHAVLISQTVLFQVLADYKNTFSFLPDDLLLIICNYLTPILCFVKGSCSNSQKFMNSNAVDQGRG